MALTANCYEKFGFQNVQKWVIAFCLQVLRYSSLSKINTSRQSHQFISITYNYGNKVKYSMQHNID